MDPGRITTRFDAFVSYSHAADDLVAPRLQAGLQRFAKPWWKRRALRVFRDESSLSASPHLWGAIVSAMEDSAWFVLLLSPDAATSAWVNREIQWWADNKDPHRIIPVLTAGEFGWTTGQLTGDAVPAALRGAYSDEPRWVDLRFAHGDEQLDLNNPRFSAAVADIASTLHGIPKDELESEEVRQHRRTTRTAWAAGTLLLTLAVTASVLAAFASSQTREAQRQRTVAETQADIAAVNEQLAKDAEQAAIEARDRADQAAEDARVSALEARAGELTAQSTIALAENPELSVLLGLAAAELIEKAGQQLPRETIAALHAATQASRLVLRLDGGFGLVAFSADGSLFATDSHGGTHSGSTVLLRDSTNGAIISTLPGPSPVVALAFSPTRPLLAIRYGNLVDEPKIGTVLVYDTAVGEIVAELTAPSHAFLPTGGDGGDLAWSDNGSLLASLSVSWDEGFSATVTVWDVTAFDVIATFPVVDSGQIAFIDEATIAVAEGIAHRVGFYDARSGTLVDLLDVGDFIPSALVRTPDGGKLILGSQTSTAIEVWDLQTRSRRWSQPHSTGGVEDVSPDSRLAVVTGFDAVVRLFEIDSGDEVLALGGLTGAWGAAFHPDGRRLVGVGQDETQVWDVSPAGPAALGGIDVGAHPFHVTLSPAGNMLALSTSVAPAGRNAGEFMIFDLETLQPVYELEGQSIDYWSPAAISLDLRFLAWVDGGGVAWVRDLSGEQPDVQLLPCTTPKALSPDGTLLLLDALWRTWEGCEPPEDTEAPSQVVDLETGQILLDLGSRNLFIRGGGFSPGGSLEAGRYVTANIDGSVEVWDLHSGLLLASVCFDEDGDLPAPMTGYPARLEGWLPLDDLAALHLIDRFEDCGDFTFSAGQFDTTGRFLPGGTVNGRAWILDLTRLVEGRRLEEALIFNFPAFEGTTGGHAMCGEGLLATSSTDARPVRLWDIATIELVVELETSAVRVPLVVCTADGQWLYYGDDSHDGYVIRRFPLDPDRLVQLARSMVTRSLAEDECRKYPSAPSCQQTDSPD